MISQKKISKISLQLGKEAIKSFKKGDCSGYKEEEIKNNATKVVRVMITLAKKVPMKSYRLLTGTLCNIFDCKKLVYSFLHQFILFHVFFNYFCNASDTFNNFFFRHTRVIHSECIFVTAIREERTAWYISNFLFYAV